MAVEQKSRPASWAEHKETIHTRWLTPLHGVDWVFHWVAYGLSRLGFLEMLQNLKAMSLIIGVAFYFGEAGDRLKQKHYQAWQVINSAQSKGGSGGRIEALRELNADGIPLVGVDLSDAFLQGVVLPKANLLRADLGAADLRSAELSGVNLQDSTMQFANLRDANLAKADLRRADLESADLSGAVLSGADLRQASLKDADLRGADLAGMRWEGIVSVERANVFGVKRAPAGFVEWALRHGAIARELE